MSPPPVCTVAIPDPVVEQDGRLPSRRILFPTPARIRGMALAWRGLRLLGWAFVPAGAWYYGFRLLKGHFPTSAPAVLAAGLGLVLIVSLVMMLRGTQHAAHRSTSK